MVTAVVVVVKHEMMKLQLVVAVFHCVCILGLDAAVCRQVGPYRPINGEE